MKKKMITTFLLGMTLLLPSTELSASEENVICYYEVNVKGENELICIEEGNDIEPCFVCDPNCWMN